jgi:hypothetical protein
MVEARVAMSDLIDSGSSLLRLFAGYDPRESIGFHVFSNSVLEHASAPVSIVALDSKGLPVGTNAFTYSRFLVPYLCNYQGHAIFMDGSDMLMRGDIAELDTLFDPRFAVQVVKHPDYVTQHPRKYVGTTMECDNSVYARKNWMSCAIFRCDHPVWRAITPATLAHAAGCSLLQLNPLDNADIGALPDEWNRLVDEGHPIAGAKVCHWTAGIPGFPAYANAPGADWWFAARDRMMETA